MHAASSLPPADSGDHDGGDFDSNWFSAALDCNEGQRERAAASRDEALAPIGE